MGLLGYRFALILYGLIVHINVGLCRIDPSNSFNPDDPSYNFCVGQECNSTASDSEIQDDNAVNDDPATVDQGFQCPTNETTFHPDPNDCHRYYICFQGNSTLHECQEEMAYLPEAELCVAEQFVRACNMIRCERNGLTRDPADCTRYYNCFFGHPYHLRCAYGTRFDPISRQCSSTVPCLTENPHDHNHGHP